MDGILARGGDVVYHWETSRGAHCLPRVIAGHFRYTIRCDAYAAYVSASIILCGMKKSGCHLPRSTFGQAIDYTLSNWAMLSVYLQDGRLEIDNNLVENVIRPTALGKKNRLFFGEAEAG